MKNNIKFKNENLYQYRKEKGLSQEELGNIIGVSRQAIYKWESGERMPDLDNLISLCEEFDKKLEDFIDGADELLKNNNENKEKSIENKKINVKKILRNILLIIIFIYLLTVIIKGGILSLMRYKINENKNAECYKYSTKKVYIDLANYYNNASSSNMYGNGNVIYTYDISYKNDVQKVCSYSVNSNIYDDTWNYMNVENRAFYAIYEKIDYEDDGTGFLQTKRNVEYLYQEGFAYPEDSPNELVLNNTKNFYTLKFLLDPFKIFKIDFNNNDLILEYYDKKPKTQNVTYEKNIICLDLKNGYVSKIERYEDDKLTQYSVYYDYNFDTFDENYVLLTEKQKNEIIENSKLNDIK